MSHIQSVLFNKKYWSLKDAKKNIQESPSLHFRKVDVTNKFYRFRQQDPDYSKYYYKTKKQPNHIEFIIGFPKKMKGGIAQTILKKVANDVKREYKKLYGITLVLVGSLGRKEKKSRDIDFITTSKLPEGEFGKNAKYGKYEIGGDWKGEVKVDIWHVDNLLFGKFLRGYPRHVVIAVRKALKAKGYKLGSDSIRKIAINRKRRVKTLRDIFKLSGIAYRKL